MLIEKQDGNNLICVLVFYLITVDADTLLRNCITSINFMSCANDLYVSICVILRLPKYCDYLSVLIVFVEVLIMPLALQQPDNTIIFFMRRRIFSQYILLKLLSSRNKTLCHHSTT